MDPGFRRDDEIGALASPPLAVAHRVLVLDQQDGADPGEVEGRAVAAVARRLAERAAVMARQVDGEGGAGAGLAVDEDEAAGLLQDAVDGRQPEADALPDLLGREERVEDPALDVG